MCPQQRFRQFRNQRTRESCSSTVRARFKPCCSSAIWESSVTVLTTFHCCSPIGYLVVDLQRDYFLTCAKTKATPTEPTVISVARNSRHLGVEFGSEDGCHRRCNEAIHV